MDGTQNQLDEVRQQRKQLLIETLWNYLGPPETETKDLKADFMVVPGHGIRQFGKFTADLYKQGVAPKIIISGFHGRTKAKDDEPARKDAEMAIFLDDLDELAQSAETINQEAAAEAITQDKARTYSYEWLKEASEADILAYQMMDAGVPEEAIIRERFARNTPENFTYSYPWMDRVSQETTGQPPRSMVIVAPWVNAHRALLTARKELPTVEAQVVAPPTRFDEYLEKQPFDKKVLLVMGYVMKLHVYGDRGKHDIEGGGRMPRQVLAAYDELRQMGYKPEEHDLELKKDFDQFADSDFELKTVEGRHELGSEPKQELLQEIEETRTPTELTDQLTEHLDLKPHEESTTQV